MAGPSKSLKYWYGRILPMVVDILNIGMAAAIPCHQVPPPLKNHEWKNIVTSKWINCLQFHDTCLILPLKVQLIISNYGILFVKLTLSAEDSIGIVSSRLEPNFSVF